MRNNIITSLSIACVMFFGCSKSKSPAPGNSNTSSIKIELVSGGSQTDTIGRPLPNNVVIKVTKNGSILSNYEVVFQGSGCNVDNLYTVYTGPDGTADYLWSLAGDVGPQTLKAYALNAQSQKVDSVSIPATAIAPGGAGYHQSACIFPFGFSITSFCKLSTGRMFASLQGGKTYLRYSDDNGISWNSVKALGNSHMFDFVVASATDELFALCGPDGIFYSKDAGATWTAVSADPFNHFSIVSCISTPSGRLFATTRTSLYVSADKGKTWVHCPPIIPTGSTGQEFELSGLAEDQSGNLYVVGQDAHSIFKSADGGTTWTEISHPGEYDYYFFIDKNNWFYKSQSDNAESGGIYVSKDKGATYTQILSQSSTFIQNMSLQSDGNLYYTILDSGIFTIKALSGPPVSLYPEDGTYVVAANNNIIFQTGLSGYVYYIKK